MSGEKTDFGVGRRAVLAALTAGAAAGLSGCATAAPAPRASASRANTPMTDFIKMRGAMDDQLVISFLTGRYFGVQDAVMTPLFGLEASTFAIYQAMPDGGYRASSFEIAYFTDLVTGAALETWRNPYTGETVPVPVTHSEPSLIYVRPNMTIELARAMPGTSFTHRVLPARTSGDHVWVSEETFFSANVPGAAKPFRYNEVVTMHASRAALDNPTNARVLAQSSYISAVSWRPWQRMGDRPGTLTGQGDGLLGVTMDQMPAEWTAQTKRRFPAQYADPATPLRAMLAKPA